MKDLILRAEDFFNLNQFSELTTVNADRDQSVWKYQYCYTKDVVQMTKDRETEVQKDKTDIGDRTGTEIDITIGDTRSQRNKRLSGID